MPYSVLEAKPISQLCTVVDCEHKTAPYVDESEYLVVRTSNVRNGQLVMDDMKYTTSEGYKEWTQRAVPEHGDVLFTREAPAGESCLVPYDKKVCMGQRMVMLRPKKKIADPVFLSLILNTERTKTDISRLSIGSTVSRINISDIKKLKVACPPIPEQRKIAKILSTWDKAIATTEQLIAASQQQKKALMQQLLTGKKRLINPETGKVFEGDWLIKHLKNIGKLQAGKFVKASEIFNTEDESLFPCYGGNGLRGFTASYTHEGLYSLIGRQGALCGNITLAEGKFHATEHAVVVTPYKHIDTKWLYYKLIELDLNQYATGQAQPGLSVKNLDPLEVLVAPLKEQQKIASVLTAADKEIEMLQAKLAHLKDEKKALMQQLLTGKRRVKVDTTEAA
ncbi:TPA: restriction endonuclease subunit S [Vibrio vulnificus]